MIGKGSADWMLEWATRATRHYKILYHNSYGSEVSNKLYLLVYIFSKTGDIKRFCQWIEIAFKFERKTVWMWKKKFISDRPLRRKFTYIIKKSIVCMTFLETILCPNIKIFFGRIPPGINRSTLYAITYLRVVI